VNDGTQSSAVATDTVDVLEPPTITTSAGSASFSAGDNTTSSPVAVDSGLTLTDGQAATFTSATVAITGGFHAGEDVLAFTNDGSTMGNIAASYNATTGVLTLTSAGSTATTAQWQSALRSITYTDTEVTPDITSRTVSFTAEDASGKSSNTATRTITVVATEQTPIVTTTGGTTNYLPGAAAVTIDSGIAVTDLDNATQSSATVTIAAGLSAGDVLAFTNDGSTMGNIAGSYNAAIGVLTLTSAGATATNAQWAKALGAVTFSATGASYGNRRIDFAVNDGAKTSATATDTVAVNAPVVVAPPASPPTYTGVARVAGPDRVTTSIAGSQHEFPGAPSSFTANAVVLVGSSDAIDGLTGAPLAAAVRAPLLYTSSDAVAANVLAEIHRVLGSSGKVYLLGGTAVISTAVETQLQNGGYATQRIAGADRYSTAVAIAEEVAKVSGAADAVFEATGLGYADALVAAPAAAHARGVVLLTAGDKQSAATAAWLAAHEGVARYAVGGPAAAADPGATAISGADRYATAVDVATRFFPSASNVALANGADWPDAAVAAVNSAINGAPTLLVNADALPAAVSTWLSGRTLTSVTVYGGTTRISDAALGAVATIISLPLS
jgi:putative cell wall-binding protein